MHKTCVVLLVIPLWAAEAPRIEVWYGDVQRFGHLGNPQRFVNVQGNAGPADAIARLEYSLNGGAAAALSMGCDKRRLARPGDFNIELDRASLRPGKNTVAIRAASRGGRTVSRTVTVEFTPGRTWRLPYTADFAKARRIEDVAQVVDGKWRLEPGGVRTAEPYYDRVIAIGDVTWKDYEAVVQVTYHKMLADDVVAGPPYSTKAHASLLLRWQGHRDDGNQPRIQYWPAGAILMPRASTTWKGNRWVLDILRTSATRIAEEPEGRVIELGRPYLYKARVETLPGPKTRYAVKLWPAGSPEPAAWDLTGEDGPDDLESGSLLLVVHHADATFRSVRVVPLRD